MLSTFKLKLSEYIRRMLCIVICNFVERFVGIWLMSGDSWRSIHDLVQAKDDHTQMVVGRRGRTRPICRSTRVVYDNSNWILDN